MAYTSGMKKLILVFAGALALALAWWLLAPLFIEVTVDDPLDPALLQAEETPETIIRGPFSIIDTPGHPATGDVRVIESPTETLIRFEDYDGTNGPDLFVYLAKDLEANEFVSLGRARGIMGNLNYPVPEDINLADYPYVLTWCRAFGVLFDYAKIN